MTDHPITPNRLREYAETRGDTLEGLRVDERAFLEACAWEWEKRAKPAWPISDHEYGKPAAPEKPAAYYGGVPIYVSDDPFLKGKGLVAVQQPAPTACEHDWIGLSQGCTATTKWEAVRWTEQCRKCGETRDVRPTVPAPSSPAAERADEGLEEEARELFLASWPGDTDAINSWHSPHNAPGLQERWMNVARAARALRRGGVTEQPWCVVDDLALAGKLSQSMEAGYPARSRLREELSAAVRERDALAAKLAETEAGRDRAYAQVIDQLTTVRNEAERLRGERDEAKRLVDERGGYGDVTRPGWIDAPFTAAGHIPVLTADAAEHLRSYAISQESGWMAARNDLARLRPAPPTVAVTDCEKAAERIGKRFGVNGAIVVDILRDCTRAASVEDLGRTLHAASLGHAWSDPTTFHVIAHEALRALGVREAEKPLTTEEEDKIAQGIRRHEPLAEKNATPFVVDREKVRQAVKDALMNKGVYGYVSISDPALCDAAIAEYERQRAEHEKGGAEKPHGDADRALHAWKFHLPDDTPPPAPAQAGWTEEQKTAAFLLANDLTNNTPNLDAGCAAIARVAPHFHKVRVKLPGKDGASHTTQDARMYAEGWNTALTRCAAALRAAGVEIEGEQ